MAKLGKTIVLADEVIMNKIYFIRGQKVMLDEELADLYEVPTKRVNEQVKRNIARFPEDFMFRLSIDEFNDLKSQNATSSWGGRRTIPFAFTEHGVLMLSSILGSERAVNVNIQIMRIYTRMREMILTHKDILLQLEKIEKKIMGHDEDIQLIFNCVKQLIQASVPVKRSRIGFRRKDEND
jgi:ORF6N domain